MLDNALDLGIKECEFWEMSIAELDRAARSQMRKDKLAAQEKASFDYLQANLIARGVMRAFDNNIEYPTIDEAYPSIFETIKKEKEDTIREQKDQLSALRFKQFANSYNKKYKEVAKVIE